MATPGWRFSSETKTVDAVGHHSWKALCTDCGFRLPETLKALRTLATALPAVWAKVRAQIDQQIQPTAPERALDAMGQIFERHCRNALSMTAPSPGSGAS